MSLVRKLLDEPWKARVLDLRAQAAAQGEALRRVLLGCQLHGRGTGAEADALEEDRDVDRRGFFASDPTQHGVRRVRTQRVRR